MRPDLGSLAKHGPFHNNLFAVGNDDEDDEDDDEEEEEEEEEEENDAATTIGVCVWTDKAGLDQREGGGGETLNANTFRMLQLLGRRTTNHHHHQQQLTQRWKNVCP